MSFKLDKCGCKEGCKVVKNEVSYHNIKKAYIKLLEVRVKQKLRKF